MNSPIASIRKVQEELERLSLEKSFSQVKRVIFSMIGLLDPAISDKDPETYFQLFTDSDGKIRANAGWFFEDSIIADRKAVYKVHAENLLSIDFKAYGVNKASKRIVSWATGVTPNFEDEAFNGRYGVGIDFIVPKNCDRVIVVLTNNYVVRTLELKGKLTATYQEILAKWAAIKDFSNKKEFHSILWESFDLQPLNKKFYAGISERFILLRQHLEKEGIFDQKHASYFANRLMGRVIFCWFLDHKSVLNSEKKYFDAKAYSSSTDYYRGQLETLFYRVLNTPAADREPMAQDDMTPFLNGGLFEPRATDLFENPKLTFPKNYFDDLFEFLSGYNFTTDESTSQFQQVAIDPEMLGRIFENLLAEMTEETGEQARKAKGAFYTPREIVDYMCRESLREYLKTKLPEDEFRDQRLEQLIDRPDKEFQDQDHNWRRDWKPYKEAIIKALDELTVLDPACGSGAFPIGMLQLLVQVYERLESRFDSYRTKLQIIEKNLYGVDIEPMAVEIARLRAWLSIIVDEEADSKKIKPLPNLEFKFICANSLIDLDQNGDTPLGGRDHNVFAEELRALRDGYFNTESLKKKKSLREKYEKLINEQEGLFGESKRSKQLKTYRPFDNEWSAGFFNPEFMFGVEKFDVVIGNPPYVRQELIKDQKPALQKAYECYDGKADLYIYFYERGLKLLRDKGTLCFITSNKFFRASYGESLRKYLSERTNIKIIADFGDAPVFTAIAYPTIVFVENRNPDYRDSIQAIEWDPSDDPKEFATIFSKKSFKMERKMLTFDIWHIANSEDKNLLQKIRVAGTPLKEYVKNEFYYGIKTGYNEAFVISKETHDKIINEDPKSFEILKPFLRGRDVKRWITSNPKLWLIFTSKGVDIERYPAIKNHLLSYREKLEKRAGNQKWYELQASPAKTERFEKYKIILPAIENKNAFTIDEDGFYSNDKTSVIVAENCKYLLGILNSRITWWFMAQIASTKQGGFIEFKPMYVSVIPIVLSSDEEKKKIESIVENILSAKRIDAKADVSSLEREIDQIVYQLYGLTNEEIKVIENN